MAIDFNGIQEGIIQTLNALVGKDACPNRQKFTSPVIKARQQGIIPDYPFAVVDKVSSSHYGVSGVEDKYYNDDLNLTTETQYKLVYNILVYGGTDDDAQSIAQEIRDTLYREYGKDLLSTNTDAGLLRISSPDFNFNPLSTNYEEVSKITLELSKTDVFVEDEPTCPNTGEIVRVITEGDLIESSDDVDPVEVHSDVTAP